ncbi:MAG: hypothetical protein V3V96_14735 [Acidiferrobacterales bacterium]
MAGCDAPGGPAFPRPGFYGDEGPSEYDNEPDLGMSLRDWFAGRAMQGCLAQLPADTPIGTMLLVPTYAYMIADAMLAERERRCDEALK